VRVVNFDLLLDSDYVTRYPTNRKKKHAYEQRKQRTAARAIIINIKLQERDTII
jgi:hypothetical protein